LSEVAWHDRTMKNQRRNSFFRLSRGRLIGDDDEVDYLEESPNAFTWSFESAYSMLVAGYTIEKYLRRQCKDWLEHAKLKKEFFFNPSCSASILAFGEAYGCLRGKIICYQADFQSQSLSISATRPVAGLVTELNEVIKTKNPIRCQHLQLIPASGGFKGILKSRPSVSLAEVILDSQMLDDIHDNTLFHLQHLPGNNGVIFHGPPGTGKSLVCQALIREAIDLGFSTCHIIGDVDFTRLAEFLSRFLNPCLLIFEDIDAFARDRLTDRESGLADFLQFLSGLTQREERWVVIATTNYPELLDKAIIERPLRFNRKFAFNLPTRDEIERLVDLYFGSATIPADKKRLCHEKGFTGAHISEIKRTAMTLSLKRNLPAPEVFPDAVSVVEKNFLPNLQPVGFRA